MIQDVKVLSNRLPFLRAQDPGMSFDTRGQRSPAFRLKRAPGAIAVTENSVYETQMSKGESADSFGLRLEPLQYMHEQEGDGGEQPARESKLTEYSNQ